MLLFCYQVFHNQQLLNQDLKLGSIRVINESDVVAHAEIKLQFV